MIYTVRPISDRTWLRPNQRRQSQFDTPWMKTVRDLEREIELLDGKNVVIECDVREQDIKMDGMLRANARLASPAVGETHEQIQVEVGERIARAIRTAKPFHPGRNYTDVDAAYDNAASIARADQIAAKP